MTIGEPRAGNQPPRPRIDAFLRGLGRVILSVFFRNIVVVGADRFPREGPVIVVSNHLNSLIDGVVITSVLPRMPRLLAANIIWNHAPLRPLLNAAGVIPIYRRQDVGAKNTRHRDTFEKTSDLLAAGGILALFPEGTSHNEPHLLPLKSGAARIAFEAERQCGPIGVRIVPVTEQNIAKLFLAAFIPGILAALGYVMAISIYVRLYPDAAGTRPPVPYRERFAALFQVWPVLMVFGMFVGGIYLGWFTPTEGAAVDAFGTGVIAYFNRSLTWATLIDSFMVTARSTAMIFFIVLVAGFYNGFLALTQVPQELANFVAGQGYGAWTVLSRILVICLIFGCVMDSLSMILLTIPIFFPVISVLDFGMSPDHVAIWFGILVLIVVEVGLITPPVGMNLFVINAMDPKTPMIETYKAVMFFVGTDIVRVILLVMFPAITLFLIP